jgi:hypothetical protein
MLAGDCVMDDRYCPSVFSLQPKHLSSYVFFSNLLGSPEGREPAGQTQGTGHPYREERLEAGGQIGEDVAYRQG